MNAEPATGAQAAPRHRIQPIDWPIARAVWLFGHVILAGVCISTWGPPHNLLFGLLLVVGGLIKGGLSIWAIAASNPNGLSLAQRLGIDDIPQVEGRPYVLLTDGDPRLPIVIGCLFAIGVVSFATSAPELKSASHVGNRFYLAGKLVSHSAYVRHSELVVRAFGGMILLISTLLLAGAYLFRDGDC